MKFSNSIRYFLLMIGFIALISTSTFAHCDSMEGPVVKASQKALETGNINYVLIWVQDKDEKEIQNLFEKVLRIRKLNAEAKELADMYFYETVVRVHRMGEGVGYTGLKPVGYEPEEGIEAADIAIEENSLDRVYAHLSEEHNPKIKDYFSDVQLKKNYDVNDLKAGREYVESYVHFIHYVEGLFNGEDGHDQHNQEIHKH